ncbi:MAG: mucoidy inhibitor MuiA family protein [Bacteroidia bacterium]|nr:mucoidy inhibitor MuiA family protein [Bacteroidia bacterium]
MRLITTAFLVLVVCTGRLFAQETEKDISSEIKQVTVFLKGAQVTRHAKVALTPGTTLLKLTGMAPSVQEPSIQVDAPPSAKILSVSFHINYMDETKKPEQIATLEVERRRILALVAEQKAEESVYQEEETILKTNKSIGGAERGVDIQELKVAMDYFRQRLQEIKQLQLQADRKIRQYNEALGKIEAQLAAVSGQRSKPTGEIVIKVSSKQAGTIPIEVKYLVQEASWFPSYDIRAKDIRSPVSITYKANVNQHSGEDWNQVQLTISSADPSQGGSRPILKPWYLGFNNHISGIYGASSPVQPGAGNYVHGRVMSANGEPLPGVNVLIKGATVGTVTDVNGFYSIPLTSDAQTLVFSYIGYNATEVGVQGRPNLDVTLAEDVTQLNEVVVTGYGNALQRRAAGVQIRGAASLSKESRSLRRRRWSARLTLNTPSMSRLPSNLMANCEQQKWLPTT